MSLLKSIRSGLAFALLILVFAVGGGLYQRLFLWPATRVWPRKRDRLMWSFMIRMAGWVMDILRLGGATIRIRGKVPTGGPLLILMNHQSVLDIPAVFLVCAPWIPLIVTRSRYARGVPLVSLMLRILGYPLVDPEEDPRRAVAVLREASARQEHGIVLFPEGHRSREGEIGAFETAGVRVLLGHRKTPVFLIVTDGYWVSRRLFDFVFKVHEIRGETEVLGPFEPPEGAAGIPDFTSRMREVMIAHLGEMRGRRSAQGREHP